MYVYRYRDESKSNVLCVCFFGCCRGGAGEAAQEQTEEMATEVRTAGRPTMPTITQSKKPIVIYPTGKRFLFTLYIVYVA